MAAWCSAILKHLSCFVIITTFNVAQSDAYDDRSRRQSNDAGQFQAQPNQADRRQIAKLVAQLSKYVDVVSPPEYRDAADEIWAGVGFGYNFYQQVTGNRPPKNFNYPHRRGIHGDLPSTGGDVFIHAKSSQMSKLFELAQLIQNMMPQNAVQSFDDVYSFVYRNGRDLTGFIDGTANAAFDAARKEIAVDQIGGSYCVTQRWIHNLTAIGLERPGNLEGFIGRSMNDSVELRSKPVTSHVARMTSGAQYGASKPVQIVRQSMPYGHVGKEAGLFFIGFAADPLNFEYMLERMVGASADGLADDIMRLSRCLAGNYWYFPSEAELKSLT